MGSGWDHPINNLGFNEIDPIKTMGSRWDRNSSEPDESISGFASRAFKA